MKKIVIPLLLVLIAFFLKVAYFTDDERAEPSLTHQQNKSDAIQNNGDTLLPKTQHKKITVIVNQVQLDQNGKSGHAFITYNGNPEQIYPVGAKLAEGVLLKSLLADGVMINNHGVLKKYNIKTSLFTKTQDKPINTKPTSPSPDQPKTIESLPPQNDANAIPPMDIPKEQSQSYQKYLEREARKIESKYERMEAIPPAGEPPILEGEEIFPALPKN